MRILSQWTHTIESSGYSPAEFLDLLHQAFTTAMSALKIKYVKHGYGSQLGKRFYLRIYYKKVFVDIGVMPTINDRLTLTLRFCKDDTEETFTKFIDDTIDKFQKWTKKHNTTAANVGSWIGKKLNHLGTPDEDDPHFQDDQGIFFEDTKTLVLEIVNNLKTQTGKRRRK
jgi:hypothetical protein